VKEAARASLFAIGLLLSVACSSRTATGPSSAAIRRVVVLGDSLAVAPSPDQAFPSVLQARIVQEELPWRISDAGVWGDTTAGGLGRVDALLATDVGVLVLELGANDGLEGVDTMVIRDNLSAIVERAQRHSIRVLLCGMETPPLDGLSYSLAFHAVFPDVAAQYSLPLVPFLLEGVVGRPSMLGPDGIHPNAAGAQQIAETVWPYLLPLLRS
jgi:acyl-CoA thioesterase-1